MSLRLVVLSVFGTAHGCVSTSARLDFFLQNPFCRGQLSYILFAYADEGPQVEFNADRFRTLSVLLNKCAGEDGVLQVEVLNAAQVTVAKLNHPPGMCVCRCTCTLYSYCVH